jgi:FtsH-binding integral membrane protein
MDNNFNIINDRYEDTSAVSKTFLSSVFSWMAVALAITGIVAYEFGTTPEYIGMLFKPQGGMSILGYIIMFAPLVFVFLISGGYQRFSASVLLALYLVFSVLMGMSISYIFLIYTHSSIFQIFFIASAMFGSMALLGYTTKTDLTKFGSIMIMGVIGIIIASIINMFMHSSTMNYVISFIGVLVFTGLTAYDVQKLKEMGAKTEQGTESASKLAIMGALTLYLDFINLFMFLLRLFGNRRS